MMEDLSLDQRIAVANAHLDQLICSVRGYLISDTNSVTKLAIQLASRPCSQTAEQHVTSLAAMLALSLNRLAANEVEVSM
jgi:hypothetical protein